MGLLLSILAISPINLFISKATALGLFDNANSKLMIAASSVAVIENVTFGLIQSCPTVGATSNAKRQK